MPPKEQQMPVNPRYLVLGRYVANANDFAMRLEAEPLMSPQAMERWAESYGFSDENDLLGMMEAVSAGDVYGVPPRTVDIFAWRLNATARAKLVSQFFAERERSPGLTEGQFVQGRSQRVRHIAGTQPDAFGALLRTPDMNAQLLPRYRDAHRNYLISQAALSASLNASHLQSAASSSAANQYQYQGHGRGQGAGRGYGQGH
ncbi:hypothetical protein [Micromonospora sp. NPDC050695]|uniref:hypothetical protein n=1 Tax=Micromonospora sp. NPDC050695 TaxID=3154938 RepID=UPI0033C6683D